MKKIIFAATVFAMALIAACDYVAIPKEEYIPTPTPADTMIRKVLLEDLTGHTCPNCPAAGTKAIQLKAQYGERLVVMGVHMGSYADPVTPNYLDNFKTTAGNAYETFFVPIGYPTGMINRKGFPSGTHRVSNYQSLWQLNIDSILNRTVEANIEISTSLVGNSLTVTASTKMLAQKNGPYQIVACIAEDSIISAQLNGTTYVPNYLHRHVFRGTIPDANVWGTLLFSSIAYANDAFTTNFPAYTLGGTWNVNNLYVVVYIFDDNSASPTYKEILQVEEKKLN